MRIRPLDYKTGMIKILSEFFRYVIVGGVAFLADLSVLVATQEVVLKSFACGVYISAVFGFCAGLAVNYRLSVKFVFASAREGKGRSFGAFLVFASICIVGLLLTEFGIWTGVYVLRRNYIMVKVVVAGLVLVWNYMAKKLLVF